MYYSFCASAELHLFFRSRSMPTRRAATTRSPRCASRASWSSTLSRRPGPRTARLGARFCRAASIFSLACAADEARRDDAQPALRVSRVVVEHLVGAAGSEDGAKEKAAPRRALPDGALPGQRAPRRAFARRAQWHQGRRRAGPPRARRSPARASCSRAASRRSGSRVAADDGLVLEWFALSVALAVEPLADHRSRARSQPPSGWRPRLAPGPSRAVAGALQATRGEERQGAWNGAGSVGSVERRAFRRRTFEAALGRRKDGRQSSCA
jgi:hypothetical protein